MTRTLSRPVNHLLAALSTLAYEQIAEQLEPVSLTFGQVLCEPGEQISAAYFPDFSMISLGCQLEGNIIIESGLVGAEGMVGLPLMLSNGISFTQITIPIAGGAMKLPAQALRQVVGQGGELQTALLQYTQARLNQTSQLAACRARHCIEQRLARWLLSVQDTVQQNQLLLTISL
ncbi:Crp/Fnr family transcriptional regulator [Vasconcelosia minhoensis]|uniref:Crp/Fnr family transcriptional regulator n=1 Tax=Vasconcelosia minhoensis TaxID=3366354 RepID=UPI001D14C6CE|nr:Crp/Fnr family transcriptional regulator [Romeria gracilis]